MKQIIAFTKRNTKLFFKDKAMFFTALITPAILLVLYATFLGNIYKDSFLMSLPEGMTVDGSIIDACVGGQLISSILAVSCVTVAFCSNMLMVQDRANGSIKDITISPIKAPYLACSYYLATLVSTLIISVAAMAVCIVYIVIVGFYMSLADVLLLLLDIVLLVMFGTAISSVISFFLSSQGQISAVGTIVSSGYGFICGAYMPISQFSDGLQNVVMMLPGTYGTSLVRNHAMRGVLAEMEKIGFPKEVMKGIRDSIDCNLYFFEKEVPVAAMYAVLLVSIAVLLLIYVLLNVLFGKGRNFSEKRKRRKRATA